MQSIHPEQLKNRLANAGSAPRLVDIREPREYDICHIEGSENIAMAELTDRLGNPGPGRDTVIICHHGIRSRQVAEYLTSLGLGGIMNLEGGLDAWARTVDPDMPQY